MAASHWTFVTGAVALAAWTGLGFALVRRAERKVAARALPSPWPAVTFALVLATLALCLRPLPQGALCAVTCIALVAASGADYRTGYLFDAITVPTATLVVVLAIATETTGAAAGGMALLVVPFGALYVLSRGRLLGLGDVKAMYAVGAAFGPIESLVALFAACVSGIVTAAVAGHFRRGVELRFAPHLASGAAFALVAGAPIARHLAGV